VVAVVVVVVFVVAGVVAVAVAGVGVVAVAGVVAGAVAGVGVVRVADAVRMQEQAMPLRLAIVWAITSLLLGIGVGYSLRPTMRGAVCRELCTIVAFVPDGEDIGARFECERGQAVVYVRRK